MCSSIGFGGHHRMLLTPQERMALILQTHDMIEDGDGSAGIAESRVYPGESFQRFG